MKKHEQDYSGKTFSAVVPLMGSAITTNIDDKNEFYKHEFKHNKTIEAVFTNYPGAAQLIAAPHERTSYDRSMVLRKSFRNGVDQSVTNAAVPAVIGQPTQHQKVHESYQQVTRNKRISTEILGSSLESTKTSQFGPTGHRRTTTHIVRKVTTLSRAEEQQFPPEDLLPPAKMIRSTELEYRHTLPKLPAIEPAALTSTITKATRRTKVYKKYVITLNMFMVEETYKEPAVIQSVFKV